MLITLQECHDASFFPSAKHGEIVIEMRFLYVCDFDEK